MLQDLLVPFMAIALGEFLDKTQIALLAVSSKITNKFHLLLGAMLAFLVVDGLAVIFGSFITKLLPLYIIKFLAAAASIALGILILKEALDHEEEKAQKSTSLGNPFLTGFVLISFAEMGDKTQIETAVLATQYNPLLVLLGALSALLCLSLLAIYFSEIISRSISRKKVNFLAGIILIIVGMVFILT